MVHLRIDSCVPPLNILGTYLDVEANQSTDQLDLIWSKLENKINMIIESCESVVLIGDLNINLLQHNEHPETNNFLNMIQEYNYLPVITRPTRFAEGAQSGTPSLLDHIYLNFSPPSLSGILHYKITVSFKNSSGIPSAHTGSHRHTLRPPTHPSKPHKFI